MLILRILLSLSLISTAAAFSSLQYARIRPSLTLPASTATDALLETLDSNPDDETQLGTYIQDLEASSPSPNVDESPNFDPLIGLYEVSYVKTARPKDNPVGGKWTRKSGLAQKILRTRRTFQHILPTNTTGLGNLFGEGRKVVGEAVNVVSLEALGGLIQLSVILRGDAIPLTKEERTNTTLVAQPLTPLSVKALFDPPRIVIGKTGRVLNINVGPKTSVLLDTLFCDDKLRLGMGGTSGSRFVFRRCEDNDEEANEFRALLRKPMNKWYPLAVLGSVGVAGVAAAVQGILRYLSGTIAAFSLMFAGLIAFSGGGIERDDMGVVMRKQGEAAQAL